ncbi:MAG: hypothetical protein J7K68_00220 [Candidatus Diapherotrites archaeon]|nr:hypothetical protein [Candidatus Diapherotrites archaeon]
MQLPHGPWKQIFSGVWAGREVTYHENPEKKLLMMIYDRKGDEIKGVVMIMTRFFILDGNPSNFAFKTNANVVVIEKNTPTFKGTFVAVSTDPKYVVFSPRNLINEAQSLYSELEKKSAEVRHASLSYPIKLIDLQFAKVEQIHEILGEPLAIPVTTVRKVGPKTVITSSAEHIRIGLKRDGGAAEELVQSTLLAVIIGDEEERKHAMRIILEGNILNGISTVVFDTADKYDKIDAPNPDTTQFSEYGLHVDPIGMPVRRFIPGADMFIDLSLLDGELFGNISSAGNGKAIEMIGKILQSKNIGTMEELIDALEQTKEKENKYYAARAVRICKLLDMLYPRLFDGKMDPKEIVAPWLKKMGRVAIFNAKGFEKNIVKGVIYTVLKTVYESYKHEISSHEIKVEIFIEEPDVVKGKGERIDKEINTLIKLSSEYGIGICISVKNELDVDKEILENATMKIQCIGGNEVVIQEQSKKPYRARLRPTLSAL